MTKITSADDLCFKDWEECRTTIGRLDNILVDLRKVGFSIITGLLTAGSFLGFLGVPGSGGSTPASNVSAAVFIAIMILVVALYCVDTNYQVLLRGAVQRAWEIEKATQSSVRITDYLSKNATRSKVNYVTLALYLVLLFTAEGFGLLATRALDLSGIWSVPSLFWVLYVAVIVAAAAAILPRFLGWKNRYVEAAALGMWILWSLTAIAATNAVGPSAGVAVTIVIIGGLLASFIGLYWIYVDNKVGFTLRATGSQNPKVYLAGPEVFDPHPDQAFADRVKRCRELGLQALVPFDQKLKLPENIYRSNVETIDGAGAVIANITPFRGDHCDVGTAFEIGYAVACGIPVWAYSTDPRNLAERITGDPKALAEEDGTVIEGFGKAENLMIVEALRDRTVHPDFDAAALAASVMLSAPKDAVK